MLALVGRWRWPVCIALAAVIAMSTSGGTGLAASRTLPTLEQVLTRKVNALRDRHGLRRLQLSSRLARAARAHALDMLARGYFAHGLVRRRVTAFDPGAQSVGENMAWGTGGLSADRVVALWMASPAHRRNLLSPFWRRIGIGAVFEQRAGGVYGGRPTTVIVADFRSP